jgi:hypothetical protein
MQRFIERIPDPRHQPAADHVDQTEEAIENSGQHAEPDQGRHAPARKHPVIDLEHEQRAGEHQDIADAAQQRDADEGAPACTQRGRQFRLR